MNPVKCKRETMSLAGSWDVALDRENEGIRENWHTRDFEESLALPGTTDEFDMGDFVDEHCVDRLSRIWRWIGPAWYRKTVEIPKHWNEHKIFLFLERTKDSQVWVNDQWMGSDDSLSTPHVFDLSDTLTPGQHRITILIDNAKLPPVGPCHQVDERTQTNWNGILGRIELQARPKFYVEDLQVYPDLEEHAVRLVSTLCNETTQTSECKVSHRVQVIGGDDEFRLRRRSVTMECRTGKTVSEFIYNLPETIRAWDEFDNVQLQVTVETSAVVDAASLTDHYSVTCGMRSFGAERGQFVINGRPAFFRGKNDCALFPLTGYAPMDTDEWIRLLRIAKDHGINHYRFHSWCPPEAAFAAADAVGIYFQVELPNKREITAPDNKDYKPPKEAYETLAELEGDGGPPAVRTAYLTREGERILRCYGNHPSFMMLTLGNELGGDVNVMKGLCDHFRNLDARHLYAMGTGHFHWDIRLREGDEFWVTRATGPGLYVRGASWEAECHIDHQPPSTTVDYSAAVQGVPVPVVGHEMAQYEVYPDYNEIEKYTGVLKARNFEIFRDRLRDAGMLDQADDFFKASGALSVICHREDVEAAIRTRGFAGFQMLDLQDFSGQGTALIGMLDVFMDSKGLITPEAWRQFCCETVPLLWMTKYTWTNAENFGAQIRVAHYGPHNLEDQSLTWSIKDGRKTLAKGSFDALSIPTGTVTDIDVISAPLKQIRTARKLVVHLALDGTGYENSYDIWVYPAKIRTSSSIRVARSFNRATQKALNAGDDVLLLPAPDTLKHSVAMAFQTSFWSPMFRNRPGRLNPLGKETPGTQGILCDPKHPLFAAFPTEFHGNWQWWHLVKNSRAMILDETPQDYRPILQVIDGFDRNHKLGLICEARVGQGKLLICSIDLLTLESQPEARQLLHSIQRYMDSKDFAPTHALSKTAVKRLFQAANG